MPDRLAAGEEAKFSIHVTDAETGEGVTTLTPYLAAAAHVGPDRLDGDVVWARARRGFGPSAGSTPAMHGSARGHEQHSTQRFGPDIGSARVFPASGAYRLWVQLGKPNRTLVTVNFDVRVP